MICQRYAQLKCELHDLALIGAMSLSYQYESQGRIHWGDHWEHSEPWFFPSELSFRMEVPEWELPQHQVVPTHEQRVENVNFWQWPAWSWDSIEAESPKRDK